VAVSAVCVRRADETVYAVIGFKAAMFGKFGQWFGVGND
jgi:hypothetical protein